MTFSLLNWANTLFLLVLLFLTLLLHRKIRRIDKQVWEWETRLDRMMMTQYRQLESREILQKRLGLPYSLPGTRGWAGAPDFLLVLAQHALEHKPETVVECSSGTSTVVLAQCAKLNGRGHVFSLESDPVFAEETRRNLEIQGLREWATVIDSPLVATDAHSRTGQWYSLDKLPQHPIDLLVIDGPPAVTDQLVRFFAGPKLFGRLSRDGYVFLDDAERPGERQIARHWKELFPSWKFEAIPAEKGILKISAVPA